MREAEIAAMFIRAAETELRMPRGGERPAGYGGYPLATIHSYADKLNWRKEIGDQLLRGDDPLSDERQAFTDGRSSKVSSADVTLWELCVEWTGKFIADERQRRALWAWAFAKAGGRPFKKWCRGIEHIAVVTGERRRDRALAAISASVGRDGAAHIRNGSFDVLLDAPEIGDISDTFGSDAGERREPNFWSEDAAFKSFLPVYSKKKNGDVEVEDMQFSARAARNAHRRAKEAARRRALREAEAA